MTAQAEPSEIVRGWCVLYIALDIAFLADLQLCENMIRQGARTRLQLKRKAPVYVELNPPPLVLVQQGQAIEFDGFFSEPSVAVTIYDFGAVSFGYRFRLEHPLKQLVQLSDRLYDCEPLISDAKKRADDLLETIRPALKRPQRSEFVEDYVIFEIHGLSDSREIDEFIQMNRQQIARILCSDTGDISEQQITESLSSQFSYLTDDRTIVTWNAAVVFGTEADDVRAVLELANLQLLEYRELDAHLEQHLGVESMTQMSPRQLNRTMKSLSEWKLDAQALNDAVSNALNLFGDPFLARVYLAVSQRFGLNRWSENVRSKIDILFANYRIVADRVSHTRTVFVEWLIVFLIALEIFIMFFD